MDWCHEATNHYLSNAELDLCWHMVSLGHNNLYWCTIKISLPEYMIQKICYHSHRHIKTSICANGHTLNGDLSVNHQIKDFWFLTFNFCRVHDVRRRPGEDISIKSARCEPCGVCRPGHTVDTSLMKAVASFTQRLKVKRGDMISTR